jgi:phosphatidylinositol-3-phosphatase
MTGTRVVQIVVVLLLILSLLVGTLGRYRAGQAHVPHFRKVAVLFLENHGYSQIIGSPQAPYLNRLANRGALATDYYAIGHPSLPNYLALTTGSTQGVTSDCNSCENTAPSLPGQLEAAHISWKAYFQSLPAAGFAGNGVGNYSKHYNPFAYSEQVGEGTIARQHEVDFRSLRHDLGRHSLPHFSWITPNLLNDGHNASIRTSDRFASRLVPRIVRALGPDGVLFVTWDEAQGVTGPAGGHVALIATGPGARHRVRTDGPADHYSLLATLEGGLRLARLGEAATASVSPLVALLGRR